MQNPLEIVRPHDNFWKMRMLWSDSYWGRGFCIYLLCLSKQSLAFFYTEFLVYSQSIWKQDKPRFQIDWLYLLGITQNRHPCAGCLFCVRDYVARDSASGLYCSIPQSNTNFPCNACRHRLWGAGHPLTGKYYRRKVVLLKGYLESNNYRISALLTGLSRLCGR